MHMKQRCSLATKMTSRRKILILGGLIAVFSLGAAPVQVGDDLELESFLNARESGNFLSITHNVRFVLPTGSTMVVQQVKYFQSGNFGLLVKLTNGSHRGETAWVYYNTDAPALKLIASDGDAAGNQNAPRNTSPKPKAEPHPQDKKVSEREAPLPPVPKDKAVATRPISAAQNKPVPGAVQIVRSNIDVATAFECASALRDTQDYAKLLPPSYIMVPDVKLANGQTQVFIFNKTTIKSFPQGTNFKPEIDRPEQRDKDESQQFATGSDSLGPESKGAVANYIYSFIEKIPDGVANFDKNLNKDNQFETMSAPTAIKALQACTGVKDDSRISSAAKRVLALLEQKATAPGGNSKPSTSHQAN